MKIGAEPRKVAILAGLLLVAAVSLWMNVCSDATPAGSGARRGAPPASRTQPAANASSEARASASPTQAPRGGLVRANPGAGANERLGEFRPIFKSERRGEALDPTRVDPTLRIDLLAKLQEVRVVGTGRNLFQFGQVPPPPRPPEPKIIPTPPQPAGPLGPDGSPVAAATVKPPPPIPLRYYGFADPRQAGDKRAFFMDGEEIRVATEGELVKQRYRVIQIGPRSAVVEDTQLASRQTLTIQPEGGS